MTAIGVIKAPVVTHWPDGLTRYDIDRCSLPVGFHIPFDTTTMECLEPAMTYLWRRYVDDPTVFVENSQEAGCYDLYEFHSWLVDAGIPWNVVNKRVLKTYRNALLTAKSPRTGRIYSRNTVRRRLSTLIQYYSDLKQRGLVDTDISERDAGKIVPRDRVPLAHVASSNKSAESSLLPKAYKDQPLHMTESVVAKIFENLGPMPSRRTAETSGRPRLGSVFSLSTGTRVDEVAHLPLDLFIHALAVIPRPPITTIPLTHTKGLAPRSILVRGSLLDEIDIYIAEERAEAIKKGMAFGLVDHRRLFVNSPLARGPHIGRPVTAHTLWRDFHNAVLAAGYFTTIPADELAGIPSHNHAIYSYHDNRHTYAITQYLFRKRSGDAEPWKAIQLLLGHKHLATTIDIYLDAVKVAEEALSDTTERAIVGMYNAATR